MAPGKLALMDTRSLKPAKLWDLAKKPTCTLPPPIKKDLPLPSEITWDSLPRPTITSGGRPRSFVTQVVPRRGRDEIEASQSGVPEASLRNPAPQHDQPGHERSTSIRWRAQRDAVNPIANDPFSLSNLPHSPPLTQPAMFDVPNDFILPPPVPKLRPCPPSPPAPFDPSLPENALFLLEPILDEDATGFPTPVRSNLKRSRAGQKQRQKVTNEEPKAKPELPYSGTNTLHNFSDETLAFFGLTRTGEPYNPDIATMLEDPAYLATKDLGISEDFPEDTWDEFEMDRIEKGIPAIRPTSAPELEAEPDLPCLPTDQEATQLLAGQVDRAVDYPISGPADQATQLRPDQVNAAVDYPASGDDDLGSTDMEMSSHSSSSQVSPTLVQLSTFIDSNQVSASLRDDSGSTNNTIASSLAENKSLQDTISSEPHLKKREFDGSSGHNLPPSPNLSPVKKLKTNTSTMEENDKPISRDALDEFWIRGLTDSETQSQTIKSREPGNDDRVGKVNKVKRSDKPPPSSDWSWGIPSHGPLSSKVSTVQKTPKDILAGSSDYGSFAVQGPSSAGTPSFAGQGVDSTNSYGAAYSKDDRSLESGRKGKTELYQSAPAPQLREVVTAKFPSLEIRRAGFEVMMKAGQPEHNPPMGYTVEGTIEDMTLTVVLSAAARTNLRKFVAEHAGGFATLTVQMRS